MIVPVVIYNILATSVFFLIMVMTLLDVMAGFMVTIAAARRDFAVADSFVDAKGDKLTRIASVWDGDVALSLMQAAPFRITNRNEFYFKPVMQAAEILSCRPKYIPKTVDAWLSHLSSEDRRERQRNIRRLTWDGAEYKITYAWRTDQGDEN